MSTWSLLSSQHQEVLVKIHLFEEASLYLLEKKVTHEKSEGLVEDFLKFFKVGVVHHFKIEERALFPILKSTVKDAEPLISELISEHKSIISKYFKLQNSRPNNMNDLTTLLKELSEHAKKEENGLPPLVVLLDEKRLKKIDKLSRQLGYSV